MRSELGGCLGRLSGLALASFGLLLTLAGFTLIQVITHAQPVENDITYTQATPTVMAVAAGTALVLPEHDAPGSDVDGLPRYPGAVRVEYRQAVQDNLVVTEVEYLVMAELDIVHDFYRDVFHHLEWTVADLFFYHGDWTFFVISGAREALVEVEARGPLVEVEIELSEPKDVPAFATPTAEATITATATPTITATPTATVVPTVIPIPAEGDRGDDDDGGGDDGGGDD